MIQKDVTVPRSHIHQMGMLDLFCSGRSILFIDKTENKNHQAPEESPLHSIQKSEQVFPVLCMSLMLYFLKYKYQ